MVRDRGGDLGVWACKLRNREKNKKSLTYTKYISSKESDLFANELVVLKSYFSNNPIQKQLLSKIEGKQEGKQIKITLDFDEDDIYS